MKKLVFEHLYDGSLAEWKADEKHSSISFSCLDDGNRLNDPISIAHQKKTEKESLLRTLNSPPKKSNHSAKPTHQTIFGRPSVQSRAKSLESKGISNSGEKLFIQPLPIPKASLLSSSLTTPIDLKCLENSKSKHSPKSSRSQRDRIQSLTSSRRPIPDICSPHTHQAIVNGKPFFVSLPLTKLEQEPSYPGYLSSKRRHSGGEDAKGIAEEAPMQICTTFRPIGRISTPQNWTQRISTISHPSQKTICHYPVVTFNRKISIKKEAARPGEEEKKGPSPKKYFRFRAKSAASVQTSLAKMLSQPSTSIAEEIMNFQERNTAQMKNLEEKHNLTDKKSLTGFSTSFLQKGMGSNKSYRNFTPTDTFKTKFPFKQFSTSKLRKNSNFALTSRTTDKAQEGTEFIENSVKTINSLLKRRISVSNLSHDNPICSYRADKQRLEKYLSDSPFVNIENSSLSQTLKTPSFMKKVPPNSQQFST